MKINCKIDNLIQNYCSNFLSYLYGWKKTMFELAKDNFIPSFSDKNKQIRIVISNTGSALLTCNCVTDILEGINFIISEFEKNRMKEYINENASIKTEFTEEIPITNFSLNTLNALNALNETQTLEFGTIFFKENVLKYNSYDDKDRLLKYLENINNNEELEEREEESETNIGEEREEREENTEEESETNIEREDIIDNWEEMEKLDDFTTELILIASFLFWGSIKLGEVFN